MTRLKLGTIGSADDNPYSKIKPDVINSKTQNLAKEVAVKSIVLLKNKNNVLPLKKRSIHYL